MQWKRLIKRTAIVTWKDPNRILHVNEHDVDLFWKPKDEGMFILVGESYYPMGCIVKIDTRTEYELETHESKVDHDPRYLSR